jgi:hypothetical protein
LIPAGCQLLLEHTASSTATVVRISPSGTTTAGIPITVGGVPRIGYRFIVNNQALGAALGLDLPPVTRDLVGEMLDFEEGVMPETEQFSFLTELQQTGLLGNLQGSYGRAATRLGILTR